MRILLVFLLVFSLGFSSFSAPVLNDIFVLENLQPKKKKKKKKELTPEQKKKRNRLYILGGLAGFTAGLVGGLSSQ